MREVSLSHTGGDARWRPRADFRSALGSVPALNISYKPQFISPKFTVSWSIFLG